MKKVSLLVVLVLSTVTFSARASDAGAPRNYLDDADLSQPVYTDIVHERLSIPMRDGVRLYAEVWRPRAVGQYGTILEWSPYNVGVDNRHGYLPSTPGLSDFFAPRGYAVVLADLRGTGNSEGCMEYMSAVDRVDGYDLVEWLASQSWSNGRVGMVGVSYVGSTPILTAAARPPHLATIVPIAGLAQMYDHEFQAGVPYMLQWAGPEGAYEFYYAGQPPQNVDDPGWARNAANEGCGTPNTSVATGADWVTGRYTPWHAARDSRDLAARADIPIFLLQGFTDGAVRQLAAEWFLRRRGMQPGDKVWLGQWQHDASNRYHQFAGALHRWFDKQLLQRDVDTGPPVEVFLNSPESGLDQADVEKPGTNRGPVRTQTTWPATTSTLTLYPNVGGTLSDQPTDGSVTFAANPRQAGAGFETAPFDHDVEIAGFPQAVINESIAGGRIDAFAVLYDMDEYGQKRVITQATMNPELRNGLGIVSPVVPNEMMHLVPPAQPMDFLVRAGHSLRLEYTGHSADKVPTFAGPNVVTLQLGGANPTRFTVNVVDNPVLYPDPIPDPPPAE